MTENTITPITKAEFQAVSSLRGKYTAETVALLALPFDQGFKLKCHWKHYGRSCGGLIRFHMIAHRHHFVLHARCKDGILYLWKDAKKETP